MSFDNHYYTEIKKSEYIEDDGRGNRCLRICFAGDIPSNEDVLKRIESSHSDLIKLTIDRIYHDPYWLSDWNMGSPENCFGLIVVFFKRD